MTYIDPTPRFSLDLPPIIEYVMTPLHPAIVHFPIVLLLSAGGLYVAGWLMRKPSVETIGFVFHALGVVACILAILSGDIEADRVYAQGEDRLSQHELLGTIATYGYGILAIWAFLRQKSSFFAEKIGFLILFFGLYGCIAIGASIGGEMVYLDGRGVATPASELHSPDSLSPPLPSTK
jgi:uncharacterized membrane protein